MKLLYIINVHALWLLRWNFTVDADHNAIRLCPLQSLTTFDFSAHVQRISLQSRYVLGHIWRSVLPKTRSSTQRI